MMNKITTRQMEIAICNLFEKSYIAIVPRVSRGFGHYDDNNRYIRLTNNECDILTVTKHRYLTEIEIKISMSDLKADFKKKECTHKSRHVRNFYYAVPTNILSRALELIPTDAGLIVVNECSHQYIAEVYRKPIVNREAISISDKVLLELFRLGTIKYWKCVERLEKGV